MGYQGYNHPETIIRRIQATETSLESLKKMRVKHHEKIAMYEKRLVSQRKELSDARAR